MKILLVLINIILLFVVVALIIVIRRMQRQKKGNETQILKMLRQLRYGQLSINVSRLSNENIKIASSKLLEALKDRELMLAEYKQLLTEKNKSLEKMIEVEKESQRFKDDFVAALTHDLKTPVIAEVNAIKLFLAGKFGEISERQKEVLKMMLKSDEDLIELSEMLLQTYKYQQTELILEKERVNIVPFVNEVFEELYPILEAKEQKPVVDSREDDIFVEIDKIHFKRVLHNLILNASKYGYQNTEITVKIGKDDKFARIDVSNTGETINEEDVKLIFEKYYSGKNKFSYLGTGLGLYCANKIITAHEGKIEVKTENNMTTFSVFLILN